MATKKCERCKESCETLIALKLRPEDTWIWMNACPACYQRVKENNKKFTVKMTFECTEEPIEESEKAALDSALTYALDSGTMKLVSREIVKVEPSPPIIEREERLKLIKELMGDDIKPENLDG